MAPSPSRSAYVAWIAVCLLWGTTYLGIRVAIETIPPLVMAGLRWTVAGALILAILKFRREQIPPASHWPALTLLGVLLMGLGNGGVVWAEQSIPSGLAAVLVAAIPFWMVGVERVLRPHADRDHLSPRQWVGLAI